MASDFAMRSIDEIDNHVHEVLSYVLLFNEMLEEFNTINITQPIYHDPLFNVYTDILR